MPTWKTIVLKGFGFGAGFALTLSLIAGLWIWRENRPKLPKPWNTAALVAELLTLNVSKDGKSLEFSYSIKNSTVLDYSLDRDTATKLRLIARTREGTLSPPFENNGLKLEYTPIFIPAAQTGALDLSVDLSDIPKPKDREVKSDYDERLRSYLESQNITGLYCSPLKLDTPFR